MNPFKVLGALPTDSRKRLQELLQNAALQNQQDQAEAAYAALIKPYARLEAELRWFPDKGTKPERPLWQLNRLVEKASDGRNGRRLMIKACKCWGAQSEDELLQAINADRVQGGWNPVQPDELRVAIANVLDEITFRLDGLYQYDEEMEERLRKLSRIKANEFRAKSQKKLIASYANVLLSLIGRYQRGARGFAGNELVEALVRRYELRFAARAEELRESLLAMAQTREAPPAAGWKSGEISRLLRELQEWSTLTMPIRKLISARGMRSARSELLADEIRLFMAEVYNRFDNTLAAKQLIYKLRDCFPEYEWLQGQLKEDEGVVRHQEQRRKLEKRERREKKLMPFGILAIILAIILNRCSPEEPVKQSSTFPVPSQESLKAAQIYMANQTLYEKALEIERKEEEIRKALVLGVKVDLNYLNEQLTKLRTEYAVLKLELTESLGPLTTDEP